MIQDIKDKDIKQIQSNKQDQQNNVLRMLKSANNAKQEPNMSPDYFINSYLKKSNFNRLQDNSEEGYFKDKSIKIQSMIQGKQLKASEQTSLWLGRVYDKCTSMAFKLFVDKNLDYGEVKTYCCEQIMSNILLQIRKKNQNANKVENLSKLDEIQQKYEQDWRKPIQYKTDPMKFINEESKKILNYLCSKYPQTNIQGVNKQVAQTVSSLNIDNWQDDQYDLIRLSGVKFFYRQSEDYSKQIMQFLNYLIQLLSKANAKHKQISNYKYFQKVMKKILSVVFKKDMGTSSDLNQILNENGQFKIQTNQESMPTNDQDQHYSEKVKKYTRIQIGSKIPATTKSFSKQKIQSGIISVENNSISRILDKWADELSEKIYKPEKFTTHRTYRFKSAESLSFNKILSEQKSQLYKILCAKRKNIEGFMKNLKDSVYDLSGKLAKSNLLDLERLKFIEQQQKAIGQFAVKMSQSSSQYFIQIIQKQINLLLESVELLKENWLKKNRGIKQSPYYELLNISLITFKTGDLFRCRLTSNENQILRVLKLMISISDNWNSNLIKIIRVKNRLQSGTRDILINFMFDRICPCQIQLVAAEKISEKQHYFDKFNHFLYQLKRAYLGPIMQICKIWTEHQGKSQIFYRQITNSVKRRSEQKKISDYYLNLKLDQKSYKFVSQYKFPFICQSCSCFYARSQIIYFTSSICGKVFCCNCWKIKSSSCALNRQKSQDLKKWHVFHEYLTRYPNFYKLANNIKEVNTISSMLQCKYLIYVPINVHFIHINFVMFIRLQNQIENQQGNHFQQYAHVSTWLSQDNKIVNDFCSQKISKEQKNTSNTSLSTIEFSSDLVDQNYLFYSWDLQTKFLPYPDQVIDGAYVQLIQKLQPRIRRLQLEKGKNNIKICAVQVQPNRFYYLPLFIIDEVELKSQIIYDHNLDYIKNCLFQKKAVIEIQNKSLTTQFLNIQLSLKLKVAYNIKQIYLNKNNIVNANFIQNFHSLKIFHAIQNQIQQIPLIPQYLQDLTLNRNKIKKINIFVNENCKSKHRLNILNLSVNLIQKIENIDTMQSLQHLFLFYNKIQKIEGIPSSIITLGLGYNYIQKIENLDIALKLQRLNLVNNNVHKIQNLENSSNLISLVLNCNKINYIQNLSNLKKLTILRLDSMMLESLSNLKNCDTSHFGLKDLKKLKRLTLQDNKIQCIFQIFGLSLQIGCISKIKQQQFLQMQDFCVAKNQLTNIRHIQLLMPYLTHLNIQKNKIKDISGINKLVSLVQLNASFNQIEQILQSSFEQLYKLRSLDLSHNKISIVPNLTNLAHLKKIQFSHNQIMWIKKLPINPIGNPNFSRQINFSSNYLFADRVSQEQFNLTLNTLECLSESVEINLLQNGHCKSKLQKIHQMKQRMHFHNMKVQNSPLLDFLNIDS